MLLKKVRVVNTAALLFDDLYLHDVIISLTINNSGDSKSCQDNSNNTQS